MTVRGSGSADAVGTFRALRVAIPILVLTLLAAVVQQVAQGSDCWLGSVSAYYYTSARAVFVAVLCAIGALLVVHQGNSAWEDHALDVSGTLAFVVAFVPLRPPTETGSCASSNVPTALQLTDAVTNNVDALLVGLTAVVAVRWFFRMRTEPDDCRRGRLGLPALTTGAVAVAAGWVLQLAAPGLVRDHGHVPAAVLLFGGIASVVAFNAVPALTRWAGGPEAGAPYLRLYQVVLAAMVLTFVVLGPWALLRPTSHVVFWLETLLIVEFAVFWVVQTAELWDARDRSALTAAG